MADEASNIVLLGNKGDPIEHNIVSGSVIPKGSVMVLDTSETTSQIVIISEAGNTSEIFMGLASVENTSDDTTEKLACITHCVADLTCGAGETMVKGAPVMTGAAINEVDVATVDTVQGMAMVVGTALEDVGNNDKGAVLINVGKRR